MHAADILDGKAYIVCKRCGDRQHKGEVSSDGSVVWMSGGSGQFHEDGSYMGDSRPFTDGGGDGGALEREGRQLRLPQVRRRVGPRRASRRAARTRARDCGRRRARRAAAGGLLAAPQ